jgi:acyl dehydratase
MTDTNISLQSEVDGRLLKAGLYCLNDLEIGDHYRTAGVTVTETHVVNFAGVSGDHYDIHVDDEAAIAAGFPGRIAHGLLGLALADGLKTRCTVLLKGLATLGWNWSFRAPLFIGDRIHVEVKVLATRLTKRPDRGIVTLQLRILNQRNEVIQEGETLMLMPTTLD